MNDVSEPVRLLRKKGHWVLEVTRLVSLERDVLHPERRRVTGTDSVVRHLKERCAPPLVREALDLLVSHDDGTDRVFELEGERWVQLQDQEGPEGPTIRSTLLLLETLRDLRVEFGTMRALHEALRSRVAVLERRSAQQLTLPQPARPSPRPAARREQLGAALRPGAALGSSGSLPRPDPVPPASTPPAAPSGDAATLAAVGVAASPAVAAPTPAASKPAITLPRLADLATCLRQLLGAEPELKSERSAPPGDLGGFYVARVIDSADEDVGAILLDARAGVELGGGLLGLPIAMLEEQAKGEPSADLLDGMNEVTNNLGGFINRANPELRVRVRALETFSDEAHRWLASAAARVGCTTRMGGRLWILARTVT